MPTLSTSVGYVPLEAAAQLANHTGVPVGFSPGSPHEFVDVASLILKISNSNRDAWKTNDPCSKHFERAVCYALMAGFLCNDPSTYACLFRPKVKGEDSSSDRDRQSWTKVLSDLKQPHQAVLRHHVEAFPLIIKSHQLAVDPNFSDIIKDVLDVGSSEATMHMLGFIPTHRYNVGYDAVIVMPRKTKGRVVFLIQCKEAFSNV